MVDHRSMDATSVIRVLVCLLASGVTLAGCASQVVPVGREGQPASYVVGTLSTDLNTDHDAITVAAAGEAALLSRGYVITRRTASQRECRYVGEYPGAAQRVSAEIYLFNLNSGLRLNVTVHPLGDLAESQSIMDAMLANLGK